MIIVVGSGIAGLSAAAALSEQGKEVLLLQAEDYIGGRICTKNVELDGVGVFPFDFGAAWIHGSCPSHPITQLAPEAGINTVHTDDQKIIALSTTGEDLTAQLEKQEVRYDQLIDGLDGFKGKEISVWDYIKKQDEDALQDPVFMHMASMDFQFQTSGGLKDVSAATGFQDSAFKGTQQMVVNGYRRICLYLVKKHNLEVRLNSKVVSASFSSGVTVLVLQDGSIFKAVQVIFSVPLKVLQSGYIKFDPPLPKEKREAFGKLGLGNFCKVLIIGKVPLYEEEEHYISVVEENIEDRGLCTFFMNLQALTQHNLMATYGLGPSADRVEKMPEEEVKQIVARRLSVILKRKILTSDFDILRTAWRSNDHFGGTYTYPKVGCRFEDWAAVGEPVPECQWFFCGEHTTFRYRGSVHGARLSGLRAAEDCLRRGEDWEYIDQKWWNKS